MLEGGGKGAVLTPGTLEWTLVPENKLGEEKSMVWTLPGMGQALLHEALPAPGTHYVSSAIQGAVRSQSALKQVIVATPD